MYKKSVRRLGYAFVLLIALAVVPPATAASPKLLKASGGKSFVSRPSHVILTKTALIAGRKGSIRDGASRSRIHWSTWRAASATAKVKVWVNTCDPSCASGRYAAYKARLTASDPQAGRFTVLSLDYAGRTPEYPGTTRVLTYSYGMFLWASP